MNIPIIILGAGGHARVLYDILECMACDVIGYVAPNASILRPFSKLSYLGNDDAIKLSGMDRILLVNGLGSVSDTHHRAAVFSEFKRLGFNFATVVHPSAVISGNVQLGEGSQIMAGAIIQTGVVCRDNVIVNTHSSLDHDSTVGRNSHISVGVTISGSVTIGENVHVGAGSTIIQNISIGDSCLVAAGAVVIDDVTAGQNVAGVPARRMKK